MTPSKTEEPSRSRPARYSDMTDERMFSRYLLCALLLIFAYIGVMAVLDRFVSPVAGKVMLLLPLAAIVLLLVWKGWIQKVPPPAE